MLRYFQLKESEEVKTPKTNRKMSETDKQDKAGPKTGRAASKVESPKASPKKTKDKDGASVKASGGGKAGSSLDFDGLRADMQKMFNNLDTKLTDKIDKLDQKFTGMFDNFGKELASLREELTESKTSIQKVETKVVEIETSLDFQYEKITENEAKQKEELDKTKTELDEKIEKLNMKLLTLEKQDRKYNLIFYGFPEVPSENVIESLKLVFAKDLEIDPFRVDRMNFNHGHRMPSETTGAPKPIILRFASYADRDLVLSKSYKLAGSRRRIVTDLPITMKKERNRLATEAYKIRKGLKGEKLKTRIREKGLSVYLQVRKTDTDTWVRRDIPVEKPKAAAATGAAPTLDPMAELAVD